MAKGGEAKADSVVRVKASAMDVRETEEEGPGEDASDATAAIRRVVEAKLFTGKE
ncbi:hypothetical protein D3C72_2582010 [compost metagenome]